MQGKRLKCEQGHRGICIDVYVAMGSKEHGICCVLCAGQALVLQTR